jgi:hypothetical protein
VISSAYVFLYGKADSSTVDFDICLVEVGDVRSPMETTDFGLLLSKTTSLNAAFNTSTYSTTAYNTLTLSAAGITALQRDGITKLGIRSSLDIAATDPAGTEYVDIYSSESAYPPRLAITYTIAALGVPDSMGITYVSIFTGYIETGDQLFCLRSNVNYEDATQIASLDSTDYFTVQLLNAATDVIASVPLWAWGEVPSSIYFSAASAVDPSGTYYLRILGNPDAFAIVMPFTTYTVLSSDWEGVDPEQLDRWVMLSALYFGNQNYSDADYYTMTVLGARILNDEGTFFITSGIPELDTIRPNLFMYGNPTGTVLPTGTSYSDTLWAHWGGTLMAAFATAGTIFGIDAEYGGGLFWLIIGIVIVGVVHLETRKPMLGALCTVPIFLLGVWMGVPMPLLLLAAGIAVLYLFYDILLTRT